MLDLLGISDICGVIVGVEIVHPARAAVEWSS